MGLTNMHGVPAAVGAAELLPARPASPPLSLYIQLTRLRASQGPPWGAGQRWSAWRDKSHRFPQSRDDEDPSLYKRKGESSLILERSLPLTLTSGRGPRAGP